WIESVRTRDIGAQLAHLFAERIRDPFGQISDGDDADEPPIFNHRKMADASTRNEGEGVTDAVFGSGGRETTRHDGIDPERMRIVSARDHAREHITLREDSHQRFVIDDQHGADARGVHRLDGMVDGRSRRNADDLSALDLEYRP